MIGSASSAASSCPKNAAGAPRMRLAASRVAELQDICKLHNTLSSRALPEAIRPNMM